MKRLFIILMLLPTHAALANRESGGRNSKPSTVAENEMMPRLNCHLRQPSRAAFALRISTSTKMGRANVDMYAPGPTDALVKIGRTKGFWIQEAGNSVALSDGNFVVRVFAFDVKSNGPYLATYESEDRDLTLLHCSQN